MYWILIKNFLISVPICNKKKKFKTKSNNAKIGIVKLWVDFEQFGSMRVLIIHLMAIKNSTTIFVHCVNGKTISTAISQTPTTNN